MNKVETAVRIIHKPTGLDVRSTNERSQLANREKAMMILTAKLLPLIKKKHVGWIMARIIMPESPGLILVKGKF